MVHKKISSMYHTTTQYVDAILTCIWADYAIIFADAMASNRRQVMNNRHASSVLFILSNETLCNRLIVLLPFNKKDRQPTGFFVIDGLVPTGR